MSRPDAATLGGKIATARRDGRDPTPYEQALAVLRIERAVEKHLAEAPPLTETQKAYLRGVVEGATR